MNIDSSEREEEGGGELVRGKKRKNQMRPRKILMTRELRLYGSCVLMAIFLLILKQNEVRKTFKWHYQKPNEIIKQMVMAEQPHQATRLPKSFHSLSPHETGQQEE